MCYSRILFFYIFRSVLNVFGPLICWYFGCFPFEIGTIRRFPKINVFKDNQELITCLVMVLGDFLTKSDNNKLKQTTKFQGPHIFLSSCCSRIGIWKCGFDFN